MSQTSSSQSCSLPAAHRQRARYATMALFFIAGMAYASWGVHVPTVRDKFRLDPAALSLALFVLTGGSIAATLTNAKWIARVGTRRACLVGGLVMSVSMALILIAPTYSILLPVLAAFGAGMATMDVAMNAEASAVEQALGRPIMSSLHGMFSIGGMIGAGAGGLALAHGLASAVHMLLAALVSGAVLAIACPAVLPHVPPGESHHGNARPSRWRSPVLWALGAVALIALIAEGAMYDWAAVYMRDVVRSTPAFASAGYAAFTGAMAAGRFAGDAVRARVGAVQLVLASASLACAGMVGALVLPFSVTALIGFAMMGLGLANMMPVLFAAAMRIKGIHAAEGLAHVASIAYVGLLFGPVLIGGVAQATNLSIGLSVVALCAALVAIVGPRVLKRLGV
ncbi:MFS transporter [Trinickia sp. Y13]|uniref:MFS transporter n=1 Tax=Trinickia sp. Y13 TaxID=2917807 RepID=UPI002405F5E6|nr:MFS transporter [Trinickia sp. Y13]